MLFQFVCVCEFLVSDLTFGTNSVWETKVRKLAWNDELNKISIQFPNDTKSFMAQEIDFRGIRNSIELTYELHVFFWLLKIDKILNSMKWVHFEPTKVIQMSLLQFKNMKDKLW